jgi:LysR family transcriptional activator of mexEF-oprN operon
MYEIDLRRIDLNLLLVFDTLMQQRSVSKAAAHLHRTQSAISHALERLRQQLNDPLLVRQGMDMVPSPFALRLHEQLHPLLRQVAQSLEPPRPFDHTTSDRTLRLAMHDFLADLFPELLVLTRLQAPLVRLSWKLVSTRVFEELIDAEIDLFIGPAPMPFPAGIDCRPVGSLAWACYARKNHPAVPLWGPQQWAHWPHVQVGTGDPFRNPVTLAANAHGMQRNVAIKVPLFSSVAPVLSRTDALATLPRVVMQGQVEQYGLVELPLPFDVDPIAHAVYSASRLRNDPVVRWFHECVNKALRPFVDP